MPEQKMIKCPFCEKGNISSIYTPKMLVTKRSRGSAKTKSYSYFTDEKYEIIVDKCPNCRKSKKEIEKSLKEGKQTSNEEIVKRLKEAGLDPTKLK